MPIAEIKLRRGTTVDWLLVDPVLDAGEPGYDLTVKRLKIGDGTTPWSGLIFQTIDPAALTAILDQVDTAVSTAEAAADTAADAATAAAESAAHVDAIGATNDTQTASFINDSASATRAALTTNGAKPVGKGELVLSAKDYPSLQAAIDDAAVAGATVVVPAGTYNVTTSLFARTGVTVQLQRGAYLKRTFNLQAMIRNEDLATKISRFAIVGPGKIGSDDFTTTGQVISLYGDDLLLADFTIDTYTGGQAVLIGGDRIRMDRVTIRNTQAIAGTGGVRMFGGTDFRATNLHVESGDDALQFTPIAPGTTNADQSISNAYYIGCTGIASQARSMIVTQTSSPSGSANMTCSIKDVGFIACQGSGKTRAIVVSNVDSSGDLSGVSFTDVTVDQSASTLTNSQEVFLQAATTGGRIRDIRFTRLHVISPNTSALSTSGNATSGKFVEAVTLTDCVLEAPRTAVGTVKFLAVDGLTIQGGRVDGTGTNHVIEGGTGTNAAKNVSVIGVRITGIGNTWGGVRHAETAGFVTRDCKFVSAAGATTAIGVSIAAACTRGRIPPRGNDYTDLAGAGIGGVGGLGCLLESSFDARDFNAKGDGVTDDAAALNAALLMCGANGGGDVLIPYSANNYMVGALVAVRSNTRLLLGGNLKALAGLTAYMIQVNNRNNVTIEGLPGGGVIDMNRAQTVNGGSIANQQGIYMWSNVASPTVNLAVRRVTVKNGWQRGIMVTGAVPGGGLCSNVVIEDCTVTDVGEYGIYVGGAGAADKVSVSPSQDIVIRRNNVSFPTVAGKGAIQVIGCSFVRVRDNVLDGGGLATSHGITMSTSGAVSQCTDFTVDGNYATRFLTTWGICLSQNCTRFVVANNECIANGGGLTVDLADGGAPTAMIVAAGIVEGNRCLNSVSNHGINTNCADGLTYANNRCTGGASGGIAVSQSANVTIVGNAAANNAARGIAVFGANANTGFHEITGNRARLNTTGDYYVDPTVPQPCRGDFAMAGAPALNAGPGSTYRRTDGAAGTTFYVKETAASSAVWAAK